MGNIKAGGGGGNSETGAPTIKLLKHIPGLPMPCPPAKRQVRTGKEEMTVGGRERLVATGLEKGTGERGRKGKHAEARTGGLNCRLNSKCVVCMAPAEKGGAKGETKSTPADRNGSELPVKTNRQQLRECRGGKGPEKKKKDEERVLSTGLTQDGGGGEEDPAGAAESSVQASKAITRREKATQKN